MRNKTMVHIRTENVKMQNLYNLLILMRPHQYIKNIFIFAPMLFSFSFVEQSLLNVIYYFIVFSITASAVYIINDYFDIEYDKLHSNKKDRPLASGIITKKAALYFSALLIGFSLSLSYIINTKFFIVILFYLTINFLYSTKLKHIAVLDIFIIGIGFVLRLIAGSVAADVKLSMWIMITTFLLALFLAIAKRRDDVILANNGDFTRKNIDGYNLEFVNASMLLLAGVTIVSYILYTVSPDIVKKFDTEYLYITSIFVILGIIRYMQLTFVFNRSSSPSKIVLTDRFLQITIVLWLISFVLIVESYQWL